MKRNTVIDRGAAKGCDKGSLSPVEAWGFFPYKEGLKMASSLKVGVIGCSVFTPELIQLLLQRELNIGTVVLMDINVERLRIVSSLAKRQVAEAKAHIEIKTTMHYRDAIENSDFILIQLRAGGQEMRIHDEEIALRHQIPFVETVTVPGLGAFLRSVPIYDEIAALILESAPNAVVMNFANPAGALTQYLHARGVHNAVGVCNSSIFFVGSVAKVLGVDEADVFMNWRGLNHLTFADRIYVKGRDVTSELMAHMEQWADTQPFTKSLISDLGMGINGYLQYYWHGRAKLRHIQNQSTTRGQQVLEIEHQLMSIYDDPQTIDVPDLLTKRGGYGYSRVVVNLMESILTNDHRIHYINVPNQGTLDGLPAHTIVEVPAVAEYGTIMPLNTGPLPTVVQPIVSTMATVYHLWVAAALEHNRRLLHQSMVVHPLFPDQDEAEQILDELFAANSQYFDAYKR